MKSRLLTKTAFALLILFFFLISLFISMILMTAASPQEEKILLEADNEWGRRKPASRKTA